MNKKIWGIIITIILIVIIGICSVLFNNKKTVTIGNKKITVYKEKVDYELFHDYYKEAKDTVLNMSLEEKVGQVFLVRYSRYSTEYFNDLYPGGYILFGRDFSNHTQNSMRNELSNLQSISKYPLILGVDEEGGSVNRVSLYFRDNPFERPRYYYDNGGYELLESIENEKANLLKDIGINLNLAPVADLSSDPNDFIYYRSFGGDVNETSEFISNMVKYAKNNKINSCLKHFPGYGNNSDTHTGVAIDNRSYDTFIYNDFKPFEAGIKEGVPSILVSHNIVNSIDSELPSSLSSKVVGELRNTLNFSGIVMTDDLAMDAVSSYVSDGRAATLALNAGCDMIITSDFVTMRDEVIDSINNGSLDMEKLNNAVIRVIAWKYYSGLFDK